MILHFPNPDTLRLALTSGAIPPAVSTKPVRADFGTDGSIWVEPPVKLTANALAELSRLGVLTRGTPLVRLTFQALCWPQLLPLQKLPLVETPDHRQPVLFDLAEEALSDVVAEILRLGNDRQSFSRLRDGATSRVLLRVIGPPYYSLLRAIDRDGPHAPRAYIERAPRVWVEVGWTHSLVEQVQPPPGRQLFLRPPRDWVILPEARFRDMYEVLEFMLADEPVTWKLVELTTRFRVPLRLATTPAIEPAELWVIHEDASGQIDELVRNLDSAILARLAFAVGTREDAQTILLRVRPGRQPPPVLVLQGVPCRSYLRLPNLFVPCGTRLHPPLRRDTVHRLLAADPARVTWLDPRPDGRFVPQSVPDEAFLPLEQWVDYVMDQNHEALTAWIKAARFEFEPFVCRNQNVPERPRAPTQSPEQGPTNNTPTANTNKEAPTRRTHAPIKDAPPEILTNVEPSELERRLHDLEQRFLTMDGAPSAPERQAVWYELARLHTALHHDHDSTVCWANAVWHDGTPSSWFWDWLQAERFDQHDAELTSAEFDRLLKSQHAPAAARTLTAYLSWAVSPGQIPSELSGRLGAVMQLMEKQETFLPVRVAWLGWVALARLAGGDALTLARARDRVLDRLYEHGLRPDQDLPGFLRFAGGAAGERFALVRTHLLKLRGIVGAWIDKDMLRGGHTHAYADLLFAFGLACLRENRASQQLLLEAIDGLGQRDEVHTWLLDAYEFRITQALEGKGHAGPLPSHLLERLEVIDRTGRDVVREQPELASHYKLQRYKIDRLREHSRILEPHERIDPYRHWRGRQDDELSHALAALPDIHDRDRLLQRLTELLQRRMWKHSRSPEGRMLVVALELAPRLGETFARGLFDRVMPTLDTLDTPVERALLLEKALFLAAHFDQAHWVQTYVAQFHQVINGAHGSELASELETLLGEVFRGLRKLGMRDEISRLLERIADLILQGRPLRSARGTRSDKEWAQLLKVLLHVAAGWFYFGQPERAWPVMEEVRQLLFQGELIPIDQTALACAYVRVLGQATAHEAIPRLEELFLRIERVQDAFTTNTHYSLSRLDVIEAAVLALVHEDFLLDSGSRRWLDDDEFAVRRRIHADMRAVRGSE